MSICDLCDKEIDEEDGTNIKDDCILCLMCYERDIGVTVNATTKKIS